MSESKESLVKKTYERLIDCWNQRDASGMASLFAIEGESIGFDGSQSKGFEEILEHLSPIFREHPTPPYICKVKEVRLIGEQVAILRAIAGMVPPGEKEIKSELNTHHTLVLNSNHGHWEIELFQNTPAQFHGRPELVEQMTNELRELLS
ncbi:MAG: SgcJ/EcaC family oxidoreductase [Anaerobacillus sp.]